MMLDKLGYREVIQQFEISGHEQICKWEQIYLMESLEGLYLERRGRSKGRPSKLPKEEEEDLLAKVQQLRAENAYLKKCKPWFWKKSDTKVKNEGDPRTEVRTQ